MIGFVSSDVLIFCTESAQAKIAACKFGKIFGLILKMW